MDSEQYRTLEPLCEIIPLICQISCGNELMGTNELVSCQESTERKKLT